MATPVEQIKERLSILDVVGQYVQLQRAGRHFKGKSPFSNEKTPSFFVSPDRGMYYCFSSGKGGDIFRFIEEMEGVDFRGALKILAERAGVSLVPESPQKRSERETLYAVLEAATAYFAETLEQHPDIRAYLLGRGLTEKSIEKWRIGFIPEGWRALHDHLRALGFSEEMLLRSGLVKRSEEKRTLYDVFRNRVMFPIADSSGRVVAFSGRTMSTDPALPKYVNSPETELYEKSHILFGYDQAKQSIRSHNFSLVVEGQFDLVLSHQVGFTNTVAISGTALSDHHASLLVRLSKRVVLALDSDRAGINSVKRSAQVLLARGMDVKVARLADGKDPADLVAKDPALLKEAVRTAGTVIEFLVGVCRANARDDRAFKLSVREEVLPFVARIPDRIDREHFEQVVAAAMATTTEAVHFEVERILEVSASERPSVDAPAAPVAPAVQAYRTDELARFIFGMALWGEQAAASADTAVERVTFNTDEVRSALREAVGEATFTELSDMPTEEQNKLLFEIERGTAGLPPHALAEQVRAAVTELQLRMTRRALGEARGRLRAAESEGDETTVANALAECAALQQRLSALQSG